ncbi:acetylcholine receptor subunit alpha-like [Mya arenaria]|uniref:acetylcholine receptor subunit alpha-like n=1 Tax=Mya arenaria TaxID=6604 RepID=UPI0022E45FBE|nr:acetylcholine receptor subunit alpha-like [Mya arenaria]
MKTVEPFRVFLTVMVLKTLFPYSLGKNYTNVIDLRTALLTDYHADIVPLANQSSTMKVNVTLYLYSLLDVDSVKGSMTMPLMTMCTWMDEQLTWTPSDYGGVEEIAFYQSEVWKPPLSLGTPVEFVIMQNDMMHVIVMYNGMAMMSPGNIIESACTFNMKFWPFDKQVCDVSFWAYDVIDNQVELNIPDDGFVSLVTKNAEWILESTRFFKRQSGMMKEVVFRLYLKRQSGFYVLTILLPIIGLSFLGTMVFLLPVGSGERVGFSMTVMLSLSVFLTVIADEMPKTSEPISIAAVLIVFQTVCGLTETMIAIMTEVLNAKHEKEKQPGWCKAFVKASQYKFCFNNKVEDELQHDNRAAKGKPTSAKRNKSLASNKETILKKEIDDRKIDIDNNSDEDTDETSQWKHLCDAIDKVSFCFFFCICLLVTIILMAYMIAGSAYEEY